MKNHRIGDSASGNAAGSADATEAGDRSHEHLSADARTACDSGADSQADFVNSRAEVEEGASPEQQVFFAFAGFGSGAGSGFEQQHPFATFSTTGHAHAAGAHPPAARAGSGRTAARAGATTAGVTWPSRARTASASR